MTRWWVHAREEASPHGATAPDWPHGVRVSLLGRELHDNLGLANPTYPGGPRGRTSLQCLIAVLGPPRPGLSRADPAHANYANQRCKPRDSAAAGRTQRQRGAVM